MYPNHRYFERHPEEAEKLKENTSREYEFCPTQSVGQHLLIDAVCNETGLDAALAESFPWFQSGNRGLHEILSLGKGYRHVRILLLRV